MSLAAGKSDNHWAFCRYHLGLSDQEIKTLSPRRFVALKKLWEDEQINEIKFYEKLVARINYFNYLINVSEGKRTIHSADEFMYFGEKVEKKQSDLSTESGQRELSNYLHSIVDRKRGK